jgi:peroxiredoxin
VTNLKGRPFALIGVNVSGNDVAKLKKVVDKEKLPWRSFADPGDVGQGPIATRWNLSATPMLYVIDRRGVIRHKWAGDPGAKVMDKALERLIKEAETSDRKKPR